MENSKRNLGSLVGGLILMAVGLLALLANWAGVEFWTSFWPLIIIGFGAIFFIIMLASPKSAAPLAIPGSIFVGIGTMMFIQNLTGHWESWAYGWTVILMSVGIGIYVMGHWAREEQQREAGKRVLGIGLVLFIVFGAFFEMLFNSLPFASVFFPIALIVLGGYLIVNRSGLLSKRAEPEELKETPKKKRSKK